MSVRKLAIAALQRVQMLRKSLAKPRAAMVQGLALTAGIFVGVQGGSALATHGDGSHLPFKDPFAFDPDFRWFEPVYDMDLAEMKPKKRANTGWYATYDKMSLWITRPENEQSSWLMDQGKGDRFDIGYMLDNDHGWAFTYMNQSVREAWGFDRERMNRYNEEAFDTDAGEFPRVGRFGTIVPPSDDNNFGFGWRFVPIRNSENFADFNSVELNKTWRLEPYHYGGILEPLVGARYMRFVDTYQRQVFIDGSFVDPFSPDPADPDFLVGEQVVTNRSVATNDMVGGQIGFRYYKFVDRFRYSVEGRVFTMGSFQANRLQADAETTLYEGEDPGDLVQRYIVESNEPLYRKSNEFAWGYDIRSEVSYTLTRMIELRGGFQMIDIAQGIWRGRANDPLARTDQRAIMAGFTFGVALNR